MTNHLTWIDKPLLDRPVLIVAFEGWNDAGDAATTAVSYLRDHLGCRPCASIDPEDFYDFTTARPVITLSDADHRELRWPENTFCASPEHGLVTMVGLEPQLQWRTFCDQVLAVVEQLGVGLVVTVGALLADVPHSREVPIYGATPDGPTPASERSTGYEGPTGIVGVLSAACEEAGVETASFWAAVPAYVSNAASAKAALALVENLSSLIDADIDLTELAISTASYERRVNDLVEDDDELREYVTRLEQDHDLEIELDEPATRDSLVEQVEEFLREQD